MICVHVGFPLQSDVVTFNFAFLRARVVNARLRGNVRFFGGMCVIVIDHIGIAVTELEPAIERWCKLLGVDASAVTHSGVEHAHMDLAMIPVENACIELLCPWDETSTIYKFIQKRGAGLHHICFKVGDIKFEWERVKNDGFPVLDAMPRESLDELIAFLHPKGLEGVLVEFKEYEEE